MSELRHEDAVEKTLAKLRLNLKVPREELFEVSHLLQIQALIVLTRPGCSEEERRIMEDSMLTIRSTIEDIEYLTY